MHGLLFLFYGRDHQRVVRVDCARVCIQHPGFKCDLLSVDGGHTYDLAVMDIANMAQLANREFNALLVDDTNCGLGYCVDAAFQEQQRRGVVRRLAGYSEHSNAEGVYTRGITVAQFL